MTLASPDNVTPAESGQLSPAEYVRVLAKATRPTCVCVFEPFHKARGANSTQVIPCNRRPA